MSGAVVDCEQRSHVWFQARCGRVTASRVADVVARTKSGYSASRANYMAQLISERLTGQPAQTYSNAAMAWGTETEPQARDAYAFYADAEITEIGFVVHPTIDMSGASPDGLVSESGLLEIKCPNSATHIDTLLGQKIPAKYITQMQWQMACTGRAWTDFVSFDPRLPASMSLYVERVQRDDKRIAELEQEVRAFLDEMELKLAQLTERYEAA